MQIAIVGLAGSGKTTVFNTLTRGHVQTGGYGGMELHVGTVKVPDERLDRLAEIFKPKKIVHADVTYFDLAAPPASSEGRIGTEELPADQLARLREADALLHVVRAFEDPSVPHAEGSVDAWRDLERLDFEFLMSDLSLVEKRMERLKTERPSRDPCRARCQRSGAGDPGTAPHSPRGRPAAARSEPMDPEEEKSIRGFRFLTQKPVLVLLNIGEADLPRQAEVVAGIAGRYQHPRTLVDALSAKIEMELGELDPEEAAVFMDELGLKESSLDRVIRLSYRLLGLISFLTAGPDEVRAWPIPEGSSSVDAAGAIHTDLARGFIRAEVVPYEDLLALQLDGGVAQARQASFRGEDLHGQGRRRRRDPVQPVEAVGREGAQLGRRAVVRAGPGRCPGSRASIVLVVFLVEIGEVVLVVDLRYVHRGRQRWSEMGRTRGPSPARRRSPRSACPARMSPGSGGGSPGRARRTTRRPSRPRGRGARRRRCRRRLREVRRRTRSTPKGCRLEVRRVYRSNDRTRREVPAVAPAGRSSRSRRGRGRASRDVDARRSARLATRRRRYLLLADRGAARVAVGVRARRGQKPRRHAVELALLEEAGWTCWRVRTGSRPRLREHRVGRPPPPALAVGERSRPVVRAADGMAAARGLAARARSPARSPTSGRTRCPAGARGASAGRGCCASSRARRLGARGPRPRRRRCWRRGSGVRQRRRSSEHRAGIADLRRLAPAPRSCSPPARTGAVALRRDGMPRHVPGDPGRSDRGPDRGRRRLPGRADGRVGRRPASACSDRTLRVAAAAASWRWRGSG